MGDPAARAFVGRAEELARLHRALASSSTGSIQLVIVAGEAGIGKTRLVDRFLEEARASGATTLSGACLELDEARLPFAPIVDALRAVLRQTAPQALPGLLGPARRELVRILPELALRAEPEPQPPDELDRLAQARLFELLLGILQRLAATAPTVLAVDDLQWADPSTLDLLRFLSRGLRTSRIVVVFAIRTDDPGEPPSVARFVAELERDGAERVELAAFGRDELAELATAIRGRALQAADMARLLERTDGNPFFATQLLATDGWEVDPGVSGLSRSLLDVLAARVEGLPEVTALIVRAASCAGPRFDDRLLAGAIDIATDWLADGLRSAVEEGVLRTFEGPEGLDGYGFRHALLRDVVRASLGPGERRDLHSRYARTLERWRAGSLPRGNPEVSAAGLALHYDGAAELERALGAHVEAADAAERAYAFDAALRHYRRALDLWARVPDPGSAAPGVDRARLLEHAATAAILLGEHEEGVSLGRAAAAEVDPATDPARAGMLRERLRWFLWEAGDRAAAAEAVAEADRLIPDDPPSPSRARVLAHLAVLRMSAGDVAASMPLAEAAVTMARRISARPELALSLGVLGSDRALAGDVEGGIADIQEAIGIARELGSVEGIALGLTNLASILDRVGRTREALAEAERGIEDLARLGLERTYGGLLRASAARAQFALGRWDDAAATLEAGLRLEPTGRAAIALHTVAGRLAAARGQADAARAHLADARRLEAEAGGTELGGAVLAAVAEAAIWRGRVDEVRAAVDAGLEIAGPAAAADPGLAWLAAAGLRAEADAASAARLSRDEPGLVLAHDRAARIAAHLPARSSLAAAQWAGRGLAVRAQCDAELARLGGPGGDDPAAWTEVAGVWDAVGRPYPAAYARFRLAEAILVRGGSRAEARAALAAARASADALGAGPLLDAIERLSRVARLDVRTAPEVADASPARGQGQPLGLTARELEVLRLVAAGWSNGRIAETLFISPKTVSVHVSNILGKLGVGGRVEAAAAAHRLGLVGGDPPPDQLGR